MDLFRIFIDMDDTLCDFQGAYQKAIADNPKIQFPQSQIDFFRSLSPLEGAIDAMQWMLAQPQFDPHILTAPSLKNPACYIEKRLWVEDHLGEEWLNRLHISPRKDFFKGELLIDDNNIGKGQDQFEGTLIHFGHEGYENWSQVKIILNNILSSSQPDYTLAELLSKTDKSIMTLVEDDTVWLNEPIDEADESFKEAIRRLKEFDDPVRYIIQSKLTEDDGFLSAVYWNVSDGCYHENINRGTFFKLRETAQVLVDHEADESFSVIEVTVDNEGSVINKRTNGNQ